MTLKTHFFYIIMRMNIVIVYNNKQGDMMMKIDVIGDIHGCYQELCNLLKKLGYTTYQKWMTHPKQRMPVFLGDLTDRGPDSIQVIELVYQLVIEQKTARYVPGNHCNKLYRYFLGNKVMLKHGIETTVAGYLKLAPERQTEIKNKFMTLYEQAPLYLVLPEIQAIIAHAGIKESMIGKYDKKVKFFVLYGDVTGEQDEKGRPIRKDWAQHYHGTDWIIYGHTPVLEPRQVNKTMNIDTGCVFGHRLTAFQLPEEILCSVPSKQPFMEDRFNHF